MKFECPVTLGDQDVGMNRPIQSNWPVKDVGPDSTYHSITKWESHVSLRSNFQFPTKVGFDLRDSYKHRQFNEDVITRTVRGSAGVPLWPRSAAALHRRHRPHRAVQA